jgi:hypothetical protein
MEILIIGVIVSSIVQFLKTKFETDSPITLLIVVGLSVVGAFFYDLFLKTGIWESIVPVLVYAGAFYTFIIRRFEK